MANVVPSKTFRKAVPERRRLYIDYDCWLPEGETLVDLQVTTVPYTAASPLTINTGYTDVLLRKITMFASGGVANTNYVVQLLVRTSAGQIKRDALGIQVTV